MEKVQPMKTNGLDSGEATVEAAAIHSENPGLKACYIAIMPNSESGDYELEVEISEGAIARTIATNTEHLATARASADTLELALRHLGIRVLKTRSAWEDYLDTKAT